MSDNPAPHDKRLHFGCGFLFGAVISFLLLIRAIVETTGTAWLLVGTGAMACGLLAMRHGEDFWAKASAIIATIHHWLRR